MSPHHTIHILQKSTFLLSVCSIYQLWNNDHTYTFLMEAGNGVNTRQRAIWNANTQKTPSMYRISLVVSVTYLLQTKTGEKQPAMRRLECSGYHIYTASRAFDESASNVVYPAGCGILKTYPAMLSQLAYNAQKFRRCNTTRRYSGHL